MGSILWYCFCDVRGSLVAPFASELGTKLLAGGLERRMVDRRQALTLGTELRDAVDEGPGIRVLGIGEDLAGRPIFDDFSAKHDCDMIGDSTDDSEVVGDEDNGHADAFFEFSELIHDLGLDGDIESGGGFVGNEQFGLAGERHGDHYALLHSPAELVGIIVEAFLWVDDANEVEVFDDFGIDIFDLWSVEVEGLGDLASDGEDGIERGGWFLKDVGDLGASNGAEVTGGHFQDIVAVE